MPPIISVTNLSKTYGSGFKALKRRVVLSAYPIPTFKPSSKRSRTFEPYAPHHIRYKSVQNLRFRLQGPEAPRRAFRVSNSDLQALVQEIANLRALCPPSYPLQICPKPTVPASRP